MASRLLSVSFFKYFEAPLSETSLNNLANEVKRLSSLDVKGRTYLSNEGINSQLALPFTSFEPFLEAIRSSQFPFLREVHLNLDPVFENQPLPFEKFTLKVRPVVADEIEKRIDIWKNGATNLSPSDWHQALELNTIPDQDKVLKKNENEEKKDQNLVIDCRNWYESGVGRFEGAERLLINRHQESFKALETLFGKVEPKKTNVLMYCTGGIRCVKLGAFVKQEFGFKSVNQLQGGIINYVNYIRTGGDTEKLKPENLYKILQEEKSEGVINQVKSKFIGKNYVFDERRGQRVTQDVLSKCDSCGGESDYHINCRNPTCHVLFIQCEKCQTHRKGTCSDECLRIYEMPEEEKKRFRKEFGGTLKIKNPSAFQPKIHSTLNLPQNFINSVDQMKI